MRTKITTLLAAALLTGLAACSNDDQIAGNTDQRDAVQFSISITSGTGSAEADPAPRAATPGTKTDYAPSAGSLLYFNYGSYAPKASTLYTNDAANKWSLKEGQTPLYWDNLTPASISGVPYSFYAMANPGATAIPDGGTVYSDQATEGHYLGSDLLLAFGYTTARKQDVSLTMKHLLSQFTLTLRNSDTAIGTDRFTDEELAAATVTAQELYCDYTLALTLVSDASTADTAKENPATTTVSTTAINGAVAPTKSDFTLQRTVKTDAPSSVSFRMILPAQKLGNLVISLAGKTYTFEASGITTVQGQNTIQPIIVKKTSIVPGEIKVTDWNTETLGNENVTADGIVTPAATTYEGIATSGVMLTSAYKQSETYASASNAEGKSENFLAYADSKLTEDETYGKRKLLYWETLDRYKNDAATVQPYRYISTFTPGMLGSDHSFTATTLGTNQESDVLAALSTATPWGIQPSFKLSHIMARINVTVTSPDGTYNADSLNVAKLTTNVKVSYLSTSYDGSKDTITHNTNIASDSYAVTFDNKKDAAGISPAVHFSAILYPQVLTATATDVFLTLTLAEGTSQQKTYLLRRAATLEAGKEYTYTLTLQKSGLTASSFTVKDWEAMPGGDGGFEYEPK